MSPPASGSPSIDDLLQSFDAYTKTLSVFLEAHPASDEISSPFAVIEDEIALMKTRRRVLARLKKTLEAKRNAAPIAHNGRSEATTSRSPRTPEPVSGSSRSQSLPTPHSARTDSKSVPAAGHAQPVPLNWEVYTSPPHSPTRLPIRPLEREDAFRGEDMLERHPYAQGRKTNNSTSGPKPLSAPSALPHPSAVDVKPPTVEIDASASKLSVSGPSPEAVTSVSEPSNSESATATGARITRTSARLGKMRREQALIPGSDNVPPPSGSSGTTSDNGKGKKRSLEDDGDAGGSADGAANLPPAKRRKRLLVREGNAST